MPILLTRELMRQIVMDHYSRPRHKKAPEEEGYRSAHLNSPNCIDDITLYVKRDEQGRISDCRFTGTTCAISGASTDIMCDLMIGSTPEKAMSLIREYIHMIREEPFASEPLGEAIVFRNTARQAARIKCATIGWDALKEILEAPDGRP